MEHPTPNRLSDVVVRAITVNEADDIIAKAINEQNLSGNELHKSLVVSGAALGIDKLQAHILLHMHAGMGMMRKALADIDAAAVSFAGDDEGQSIIAKLRAPFVERIREHIDMFVAMRADTTSELLGVDEKFILARRIIEPTDTPEWKDAAVSASMHQQPAFAGFVLADDVSKMECACFSHLTGVVHEKGHPPLTEVIAKAREKFGSLEAAMMAFFRHALEHEFEHLDKFEQEFGNLESMGSERASEETNAILSRYVSGNVPPEAGLDPH